jgi:hypothetical protein
MQVNGKKSNDEESNWWFLTRVICTVLNGNTVAPLKTECLDLFFIASCVTLFQRAELLSLKIFERLPAAQLGDAIVASRTLFLLYLDLPFADCGKVVGSYPRT